MNYFLFAIYDRVAGSFSEPFCCVRVELAVRRFNYVMSTTPMIAQDCELYCVGEYNSESGIIKSFDNPQNPQFVCRYEVNNG